MVLLIDIGNTIGKAVIADQLHATPVTLFDPEHPAKLEEMLSGQPAIRNCLISSVRELPLPLMHLLKPDINVIELDSHLSLPYQMGYQTPATLGPDRIALVAAAWQRFPQQNVLIIDMGSCITYDFLDKDAVYRGGAISPGIQMRFRAMHHFTARLPLANPEEGVSLMGTTTITSLQSGVMHGVQAEIDGIIMQYEHLYKDLTVIIGGGDNKYFDKRFKINIFAGSNLVLEGLKVLLDFNDIG